jgi:two-component system chemotaxis response regulator CheY
MAQPTDAAPPARLRILVVEDSPVARLALQRTIEGLGHEALVATGGAEAWSAFETHEPDVIVSDWLMPGVDGLELCRRVRARPGTKYPYFIFLTALTDREHTVTAMEAGADDFIVKPLDRLTLQAGLIAAARVTGLHAQLGAQRAELERLNRLLRDDARRDALTHLGNRLRLDEDLEALAARFERYGHRYAVAMCDIDYFKRYNDAFGHPAGDDVLTAVADCLRTSARHGDTVYRYGGEEFVVILPEQSTATAAAALERLRAAVEGLRIAHPANQPGVVTISAGVAELRAGGDAGIADCLRRADQALYRAKGSGRNRVAADGDEETVVARPAA